MIKKYIVAEGTLIFATYRDLYPQKPVRFVRDLFRGRDPLPRLRAGVHRGNP
jgi:hypothetical protein